MDGGDPQGWSKRAEGKCREKEGGWKRKEVNRAEEGGRIRFK
jgi:hypothetical protein